MLKEMNPEALLVCLLAEVLRELTVTASKLFAVGVLMRTGRSRLSGRLSLHWEAFVWCEGYFLDGWD